MFLEKEEQKKRKEEQEKKDLVRRVGIAQFVGGIIALFMAIIIGGIALLESEPLSSPVSILIPVILFGLSVILIVKAIKNLTN